MTLDIQHCQTVAPNEHDTLDRTNYGLRLACKPSVSRFDALQDVRRGGKMRRAAIMSDIEKPRGSKAYKTIVISIPGLRLRLEKHRKLKESCLRLFPNGSARRSFNQELFQSISIYSYQVSRLGPRAKADNAE